MLVQALKAWRISVEDRWARERREARNATRRPSAFAPGASAPGGSSAPSDAGNSKASNDSQLRRGMQWAGVPALLPSRAQAVRNIVRAVFTGVGGGRSAAD